MRYHVIVLKKVWLHHACCFSVTAPIDYLIATPSSLDVFFPAKLLLYFFFYLINIIYMFYMYKINVYEDSNILTNKNKSKNHANKRNGE